MSKALGGSVGRNPVKELGWGEVETTGPAAADWLGDMKPFEAFHWHGEMTEAMIRLWCRAWGDEKAAPGPSVQTPEQMHERIDDRIAAMRAAADRLYARWIAGLGRN